MPAMSANSQQVPEEGRPLDEAQIDALGAYIQANGGGPTVVRRRKRTGRPGVAAHGERRGPRRRPVPAQLRVLPQLHRQGRRAVLRQVRTRPQPQTNPQQIYTAMLTGPQNMPVFSDRQLSPEEKKDIVAYVRHAAEGASPGGYGLGGFGPTSEGMFIWIIGMVATIGIAMWIGARLASHERSYNRPTVAHRRRTVRCPTTTS